VCSKGKQSLLRDRERKKKINLEEDGGKKTRRGNKKKQDKTSRTKAKIYIRLVLRLIAVTA